MGIGDWGLGIFYNLLSFKINSENILLLIIKIH